MIIGQKSPDIIWPKKIKRKSASQNRRTKSGQKTNDMNTAIEGIVNFQFGQLFAYEK
jgi:hypothetical protein